MGVDIIEESVHPARIAVANPRMMYFYQDKNKYPVQNIVKRYDVILSEYFYDHSSNLKSFQSQQ
ncbi:hypothetical protein AASFL403_20300 [Paenibacillus nuruki]|nr:hypothetical protein AASFL403_20300 [Paenibacillus nuruki]